jgi:predicted transcriptional regulator
MRVWYDDSMSTERVTITLPADVIAQLDEIADARDMSRSSVVREAAARYIAGEHERERAVQLQAATSDLLGFLDSLQAVPVLDDRPVLEILRELRGGPLEEPPAEQTAACGGAESDDALHR